METSGRDEVDAARAFRPNARPALIAIGANVLLAALFLGLPYWLGHAQAKRSLGAFSRFAGCFLGGEPQPQLGLGLPAGDRDRFAAKVLRAGPAWPQTGLGANMVTWPWPKIRSCSRTSSSI